MRPGARAGPPGRSPNANPADPQSADRPLVTITEDAQQPSITKPAQQPGRPTHFASAGSQQHMGRFTRRAAKQDSRCRRRQRLARTIGLYTRRTHDNQLCTELAMGCKRTLCCLQIGASGRSLVADAGVRSRPIEPLVLSAQERTYLERQVRRHRAARSLSERCRTIHLVVQAIWSNCLP
jgi:hypothetical protein